MKVIMKLIKLLIFLVIFAIAFPSCVYSTNLDKSTGVLVDRDVMSSILQDMEDKENSYLVEDGEVFWTPSGKIWHATYECSYLSNSKEIYHGSIEEAMLEGKERACTRCFATDLDKEYEKLKEEPIVDGDVFFTRNENEWHTSINCSKLRGAENIYNSSIEKAIELGKTMACDECR